MEIKEIIGKYNDRDSLFRDGMTNHLNMGLFALYKLGADERRLLEYAEDYTAYNKLPPMIEAIEEINEDNFETYIGNTGIYSSFIPFFEKQLELLGTEDCMKKYVNRLIDGSSGDAFHGLIRLAYAYELGDPDEMGKGLAYFAESYRPFPIEIRPASIADPKKAIAALAEAERYKSFPFGRKLILGRMMDVYEDSGFMEVMTDIDRNLCNDKDFGELLLWLYGTSENFTMLHGLTSTHALRILKPVIEDYERALKQHWIHLQLAYLSTGCASIGDLPEELEAKSWEALFKAAVAVKDVHTIKLVYSLHE